MAEKEEGIVTLQEDFYRDRFGKVIFIIVSLVLAIFLLIAVALYLYSNKPPPVTFVVGPQWRIKPIVPLNQPYLSTPEILQWVSEALPNAFVYDYYHYGEQLQKASQFFTRNGWKVFLNQLNSYVNYNNVQAYKMFVTASPAGAPFVLQQGILSGKYVWWVQMPIDISYIGYNQSSKQNLTLQVLMVRVSTLNNLAGVGIENVLVVKNTGKSALGNESS